MLPDRVSNPVPLTYESGALPIALRGPANVHLHSLFMMLDVCCLIISLGARSKYFVWKDLTL